MKPGLVYALLIAIVIAAASLFMRSNSPVPRNPAAPATSPDNESVVQEAPVPKQEAMPGSQTESGSSTIEPSGKNTGDKE